MLKSSCHIVLQAHHELYLRDTSKIQKIALLLTLTVDMYSTTCSRSHREEKWSSLGLNELSTKVIVRLAFERDMVVSLHAVGELQNPEILKMIELFWTIDVIEAQQATNVFICSSVSVNMRKTVSYVKMILPRVQFIRAGSRHDLKRCLVEPNRFTNTRPVCHMYTTTHQIFGDVSIRNFWQQPSFILGNIEVLHSTTIMCAHTTNHQTLYNIS